MLLEIGDQESAGVCLREARDAHPSSARTWVLSGDLCRTLGDEVEAMSCFEKALSLSATLSERIEALNGIAGSLTDNSRNEEANDVYRSMIALAPEKTLSYYYLVSSLGRVDPSDVLVATMLDKLVSGRLTRWNRMHLHYALGKVFDTSGRHAESFAHFMAANAIRSRYNQPFDESKLRNEADARMRFFDAETIARLAEHGDHDDFLICIVGMPRSGTTLLEQIISSHPEAIGLGERTDFYHLATGMRARLRTRRPYPECCSSMTPGQIRDLARKLRERLRPAGEARRSITKLPRDCWEIGLIKGLFPNAKIVYSVRDPIDTCLSCYMQNFHGVNFSTDLDNLASFFRMNSMLMDHWKRVLGSGEIFEASYERLVSDPEPIVRALYEYCGLSHNEGWSTFWSHSRRVDTASQWQVRRPIYHSSVQRWRNYSAFLGPLLELDEGSKSIGADRVRAEKLSES